MNASYIVAVPQVQREFYPSLVDIGAEFDAGLGKGQSGAGEDMLGRPDNSANHASGAAGMPRDPPQSFGRAGEREDGGTLTSPPSQSPEGVLRFSAVVAGSRPVRFPLDWASLKALYGSLAPTEKEGLGLQVGPCSAICPGDIIH